MVKIQQFFWKQRAVISEIKDELSPSAILWFQNWKRASLPNVLKFLMQNQMHPCFIFNLQWDTWQLSHKSFSGWCLTACWDGLHAQVAHKWGLNPQHCTSAPFKVNLNTLDLKGNEKWVSLLSYGTRTSCVLAIGQELLFPPCYSQLWLSEGISLVHIQTQNI